MAILTGLAVGAGIQALGGGAATLGTIKQRKQAKRYQRDLDTTLRDTSATAGVRRGMMRRLKSGQQRDTSQFMDEMSRMEAAGVNPTLLNQRRKFHMDARAEAMAIGGAQAEMAARSALGAKREALERRIAATPSAGDRFLQGMGIAAPVAGAVGAEAAQAQGVGGPQVDTPDQIDDVANAGD